MTRSLLALLCVSAACSGDGGGGQTGSTGAITSASATATESATASPTEGPTRGPVGEQGGVTFERAHFALKSGAHRVEAGGDAKVGITVVGYDVAVSFGYAGGSGAAFIGEAPGGPQL